MQFNSERFASDQAIGSLSGGEALKVQLLHELCRPHELLFLDEPSNDLDLETLDWLQQMIQTSPQTILFISHHEDFLTQTADTIIHLRQVKHRKEAETIVEHLGYQDYSSQGATIQAAVPASCKRSTNLPKNNGEASSRPSAS